MAKLIQLGLIGLLSISAASSAAAVSPKACTIGSVISAGYPCETSVVLGLTRQIANELTSMGIAFGDTSGLSYINCIGGCTGLMQQKAITSLATVTAAAGDYITITSMWRSAAQQYLLYQWKALGLCGQTNPVARPGTSNHEGGIAIDVPSYSYWMSYLTNNGWYWLGSGDPVHFEYGSASDYAKKNLMAFQKLWNKHNPGSQISEDGLFGPATASAFENSPCDGW